MLWFAETHNVADAVDIHAVILSDDASDDDSIDDGTESDSKLCGNE